MLVDVVTAPARTFVGPDELSSFVADAIARYDHFAFVILNAVVDLGPGDDDARGRMFMCEVRHDPETDSWPIAHGVYEDRYSRVDGRWRFAARRYRSMARMGPEGKILGLPPDLTPNLG